MYVCVSAGVIICVVYVSTVLACSVVDDLLFLVLLHKGYFNLSDML